MCRHQGPFHTVSTIGSPSRSIRHTVPSRSVVVGMSSTNHRGEHIYPLDSEYLVLSEQLPVLRLARLQPEDARHDDEGGQVLTFLKSRTQTQFYTRETRGGTVASLNKGRHFTVPT